MLKDIKIRLENSPGALAGLGEALGKDGVNIEGFCGPCEGEGIAHILVNNKPSARNALETVSYTHLTLPTILLV